MIIKCLVLKIFYNKNLYFSNTVTNVSNAIRSNKIRICILWIKINFKTRY